jgi:hypothetical protein
MAAAAHNAKFAKKVGIPQSVAKEFNAADQAKARRTVVERAVKRKGRKS